MAFHPTVFQICHKVIARYMCASASRNLIGFCIIPASISTLFIIPSLAKKENAMAYTNTQLIKFGKVVSVCTSFRYHLQLISLRKIAKNSGRIDDAIPRRLMANVFFSTCIICATWVGLENKVLNHCQPTNSH